jgi:hypothetical protein
MSLFGLPRMEGQENTSRWFPFYSTTHSMPSISTFVPSHFFGKVCRSHCITVPMLRNFKVQKIGEIGNEKVEIGRCDLF